MLLISPYLITDPSNNREGIRRRMMIVSRIGMHIIFAVEGAGAGKNSKDTREKKEKKRTKRRGKD